jgi:sugar phosphate permease
MALTTFGVFLFLVTPKGNVPMIFISLSITGFFVYVPQLLVGVYVMDIAPKSITATATGFTGLTSYIAAAIIGDLIAGIIVDQAG